MSSIQSYCFKFILAVILFVIVNALDVPSYHKPCKFSDPKFEQCAVSVANAVMENFKKGDATLINNKLRELKLPLIIMTDNADVHINISDFSGFGLEDLKVLKIKKVPGKNRLETVILVKELKVAGVHTYDVVLDGKHIGGKGKGFVTFSGIHYKCNFEWNLVERNGDKYMEVTKIDAKIDNVDNVVHKVDGVDNNALNENWAEYVAKVAPSIIPYLENIVHLFTDTMFKQIPYNKLFLD